MFGIGTKRLAEERSVIFHAHWKWRKTTKLGPLPIIHVVLQLIPRNMTEETISEGS